MRQFDNILFILFICCIDFEFSRPAICTLEFLNSAIPCLVSLENSTLGLEPASSSTKLGQAPMNLYGTVFSGHVNLQNPV